MEKNNDTSLPSEDAQVWRELGGIGHLGTISLAFDQVFLSSLVIALIQAFFLWFRWNSFWFRNNRLPVLWFMSWGWGVTVIQLYSVPLATLIYIVNCLDPCHHSLSGFGKLYLARQVLNSLLTGKDMTL